MNLALTEVRAYLSDIEMDPEDRLSEARRISDVHIMDHLQRLAAVVTSEEVYPGSARLAQLEQRLSRRVGKTRRTPPRRRLPEVCTLAGEIADILSGRSARRFSRKPRSPAPIPPDFCKSWIPSSGSTGWPTTSRRIETHLATSDDAPTQTS